MKRVFVVILLSLLLLVSIKTAFASNIQGWFDVYRTGEPVSNPNVGTNRYHVVGSYVGTNFLYLSVEITESVTVEVQKDEQASVLVPVQASSVLTIYYIPITSTLDSVSINLYLLTNRPTYVTSFSVIDPSTNEALDTIHWWEYGTEYLSFLALMLSRGLECVPNFNC